MADFKLPAGSRIGYVHLRVMDMANALNFYRDLLGLRVLKQVDNVVHLVASKAAYPMLLLSEAPGAPMRPERAPGLYHMAIRYPDRPALGSAVRYLAEHRWPIQGMADHGVSDAIYLSDPEGNGIELYADKPREQWPRRGNEVAMLTEPLDLDALLAEAGEEEWTGIAPETELGHIHLRVSSLERAEEFYSRLLGMNVMQRNYPGALFLAAGDYHHHVGANIWHSRNAPPAAHDALGLLCFSIHVPERPPWEEVLKRVRDSGVELESCSQGDGLDGVLVHDGDGIGVDVMVASE